MGLGGARRYEAFKVIVWREAEWGEAFFMAELTPQVFYQNYIATYFSIFWSKESSIICILRNILY